VLVEIHLDQHFLFPGVVGEGEPELAVDLRLVLWGSESHRRRSSGVPVLVDGAAEDAGGQESVAVEVVDGGGLPGGVRGSLISGPVRSMRVVVPFEVDEDLPGVGLVLPLLTCSDDFTKAAAREGRPESEYFREAFRIAALRARRWSGDWDIPEIGFGGPVTDEDVRAATEEAANRKYGSSGSAA